MPKRDKEARMKGRENLQEKRTNKKQIPTVCYGHSTGECKAKGYK